MNRSRKSSPEKKAYSWLMSQTYSSRKLLITSILTGLISSISLLIQISLLASIIHQLIMDSVPRNQLLIEFILFFAVVLIRACCAWGKSLLGFKAGMQVRIDVRKALLNKLQRLGPMAISRQTDGSWTTIVVEQVEDLHEFIASYLPQKSLAALIPLLMLIVVFPKNWTVGIIFLVTAPLIPIFMALVGMKAAKANRRNFKALERLGGYFLDRLQGMETLRLLRRCQQAQQELSMASEDFRHKTIDVLRIAFLSSTVLEFFGAVSIALTAIYLGMSFLGYINFGDYDSGISLYTALFLLLLAPEFYQPLRELGTYYHAKAKAVAAAESILEVMNQDEPNEHKGSYYFEKRGAINICAKGLTVSSPTSKHILLDNLNFTIKAGSRVAIVGPSGAGKTTLINALMGFYPYDGILKVNEQLISEVDLCTFRENIAWLGQFPLIIDGSIMDNIAFGRDLGSSQVLNSLERAHGIDILDGFPDGLNSRLQEHGSNLSIGQAQRIALARAIATQVELLILDEPTASLDSHSEQCVLTAIRALPKCTTVITVTHRIKQIMAMDQVLMISEGRLIVAGNPIQLMQNDGSFKHFIEGQNRNLDNG